MAVVLVSAGLLLAGCDTAVDAPTNDSVPRSSDYPIGPVGEGPQAAAVDLSSAVSVAPDGRLYGCVLSAHLEGDTSRPYQYRYAQLAFPEAVAAKALGEQRLTYRLRTEDDAVLRQATCLIPATEEARDLVFDWVGLADAGDEFSTGFPTDDPTDPTPILYDDAVECHNEPGDDMECSINEVVVTEEAIDDGGGGGGGWWDPFPPDSGWSAPWDDDPSGGPGSGGDDNDDENEDDCGDQTDDGGSGGGDTNPPPPTGGEDPCGADCYDPPTDDGTGGGGNDGPHDAPGFMVGATWHVVTSSGLIVAPYAPAGHALYNGGCDPADEPMSKEEVATEFIEACDLPASTGQNDDVMSNIFEASINATFNASSPPSHNFRSGIHHQYADPLDGYSTAAFDMQNGSQLDLLTGIIESKFTEDPSSQIGSGQSQGHINALASTYDLIPPGATFTGAPVYTLVTNSQVPVEMIGRYSQGAGPYDLVTYANARNVNFIHYRVMRTFLGNIKLEGDLLGDPQTTRSAIQDFFGDFDVDFVIDCSPAN